MNAMKAFVLAIVALVVAAGCAHTGKPRTFDREQAKLYPRVLYKAINDNKDSLDFILSLEAFYEEFGKDKKPYQLSVDEMKMAKKILEKYVENGGNHLVADPKASAKTGKEGCDVMENIKPLPLTHYYKQYLGYEQKGHLIVEINLLAFVYVNYGESVSAYLQRVYSLPHDGGKHFGRVLVDLTEKKVIRFSLNAVS
ncbi:MAG: hypothetical protein ACFN4S_02080 [Prevotella conceptionensis]|jgi:hypothetical protein|uniref:hypothetical protein n=1 Tax=Prevotella conceptionensis TaxID=340486 RepID=UPI0005C8917F|nr:hypothetical protein [Prevotella conceptionensis]